MMRLVKQLKFLIFDYFFTEGVCAYFRISISLFKMMESSLKKIDNMCEFVHFIEENLKHFSDFKELKKSINGLYINNRLINYIRMNLITKETSKYHKNFKHRYDAEKCIETSPYCFYKKNSMFDSEFDFVLKRDDVISNLHFDYFYINKRQFRMNSSEMLGDAYFDSKSFFPTQNSQCIINTNENIVNKYSMFTYGAKKAKETKKEKNPIVFDSSLEPSLNNTNTIVCIDSLISIPEVTEKEILCLRTNHVCHFKAYEIDKKRILLKKKNLFFKRSIKNLMKFLGTKLRKKLLKHYDRINIDEKASTQQLVQKELANFTNNIKRNKRGSIFKKRGISEDFKDNLDHNCCAFKNCENNRNKSLRKQKRDHFDLDDSSDDLYDFNDGLFFTNGKYFDFDLGDRIGRLKQQKEIVNGAK